MQALILNGKVVDLAEAAFEVHADMQWVEAPDGVQHGWAFDGTTFTAPEIVQPTYDQLRAAAYPSIADQLDTLYHGGYDAWKAEIAAVKNQYPKTE